tara:strand:- start:10049 stop:10297 length:249 start_codon:yes stop_codon:yes gene_type:complete
MAAAYVDKMTRLGSMYYTVRLDERGAVGVTKWAASPSWPVIEDVSTLFVTLAGGMCVAMPEAPWAAEAVERWHATRERLQEM